MSVHVTSWVWRHSAAQGNTRLVALAIADHSDDDGLSWPSQQKLAQKCLVSVSTVGRSVRELIELGELRVESGASVGRPNRYVMTMQTTGVRQNDRPSPEGGYVTADVGGYVTGDVPGTSLLTDRTVREPSETTVSKTSRASGAQLQLVDENRHVIAKRPVAPSPLDVMPEAARAMLDRLTAGAQSAVARGVNAWDLALQVELAYDALVESDGMSAASAFVVAYAALASGRELTRTEALRVQHVVFRFGRVGVDAVLEAVAQVPDDLGQYALRVAQRKHASA